MLSYTRCRSLFWFLLTLLASLFIIIVFVLVFTLLLRIIVHYPFALLDSGVAVRRHILFWLKDYIRRWHLSDRLDLRLPLFVMRSLYVSEWLFILQGSIAELFISGWSGPNNLAWVVMIGLGSGDWLFIVTTATWYNFKVNLLVVYYACSLCRRLSRRFKIAFREIFNKTLNVRFCCGSAHSVRRLILLKLLSSHLRCKFATSLLHWIAFLLINLFFLCLFRWLWVAVFLADRGRLLLIHMRLLLGWLLIKIILYVRLLTLKIRLRLHKVRPFLVIYLETDIKCWNQEC